MSPNEVKLCRGRVPAAVLGGVGDRVGVEVETDRELAPRPSAAIASTPLPPHVKHPLAGIGLDPREERAGRRVGAGAEALTRLDDDPRIRIVQAFQRLRAERPRVLVTAIG